MIAESVFILSLMLIAYTYAGYPMLVFALSRLIGRPVMQARITPKISLIIAAYNEERDIASKIENSLALDYAKEKLEIIVASDCSTDRTDEIARRYTDRNVLLHRQPEREGKSVAQNDAVRISTGEILLFSDATTIYQRDALRKIARNFADPEVGCVAGNLVYVDRSSTAVGRGCRSYWSYEKFLKQCESRLGSLIGVSGCLYGVRRSSYARIARDMSSDFVIATEIHLQGLRTVYEEEAVSIEDTNERSRDEFRMRVRVIEQTMSAMDRYREALNPQRHGMYAFQMISHKLLRYAVPLFLIAAFISNLFLVNEAVIYQLSLSAQSVFYVAALAGFIADRLKVGLGPLAIPYYFVLANAASLIAFFKYVRGEAHIVWEPLRQSEPQIEPSSSEMREGISK